MKKFILLTAFLASFTAQAQTQADFYTSMGNFRVELREDLMPITANNFIKLSRKGFYDATIFHRVVTDFVIQGGDPIGDGSGGPGYTIQDEDHISMNHDSAGVIGMAKDVAPNSAGSQFYFTLSAQPGLNRRYAVFGSCIQGLQVILDIGMVRVNANDKPLVPVILDSVRVLNTTAIGPNLAMQMPLEVFPNPFAAQSYIRYEVNRAGPLRLGIYDLKGRLVRSLIDGNMSPGIYDASWDGRDAQGAVAPAGVYLLLIQGMDGVGEQRLLKL